MSDNNIQSTASRGRVADAPSGHWTYKLLPRAVWPYAQLARWDRPIGWWLLLWPCWWSAAMAAAAHTEPTLPVWSYLPDVWHLFLFLVGAIAMRGAGCTYNDIVDYKIDAQVARTRSRPLPSGQISKNAAKAFLVAQALVGFVVLIQFNLYAIIVGLFSLLAVAVYPFMKRVTNWPQLFLGLAFSWGAWMGWAALYGSLDWPPVLLYLGCIAWTIGYDTIYAHQDKEDDAIVGVKSTALLFGTNTKAWLGLFYGLTLLLFAAAFVWAGLAWPAFVGLLMAAVHMQRQIRTIDIDDADQCLALFKSNTTIGWLVFFGLVASGAVSAIG
ncbi:MAG: 4-hydroxybenzoate octaprenyltransferase [Ahrensia sp.]